MSDVYVALPAPQDHYLFESINNPHVTLVYFVDTPLEAVMSALTEHLDHIPYHNSYTPWNHMDLSVTGSGVWVRRDHKGAPQWVSHYLVEDMRGSYYLTRMRDYVLSCANAAGIEYDDTYPFTPHITRFITTNPLDLLNRGLGILSPGEAFSVDDVMVREVRADGPKRTEYIPIRKVKDSDE